jgi:DNA-binding CsgD family transcriptional regulator
VLVVRGEAGVGKSALLDYLAASASGGRVVRAAGVESEMELAFAAVHQLCVPMLGRIERLPGPQREAVGTAFGLDAGEPPNLFLVGLAVLGLLSDVAGDGPLLCLVDDAQWLDRASARVLTFVARRLLAEPVALLFSLREPTDDREFRELPTLAIGGLRDDDARTLLESAVHGKLDERVRDRIVAESRGNPLALLELPRTVGAANLDGGFAPPDAAPLASRIEQSFLRCLESLPLRTRRLLLTAAAEPTGDVALLWRAAERLDLALDAAAPAQAAGLIELGTRVRFRHPLVRSAVYHSAALHERQQVHRALAEATDARTDPDRQAWHRARGVVGPDEAVAAALERAADRAQLRGGIAAAAAFLERATRLTSDSARRAARALTAARAKLEIAALDAASELLAIAELGPLDELQGARLARLRGQISFARTHGREAPRLLLDAARRLERHDVESARETYLEALGAAIMTARLGGHPGEEEIAAAARSAPLLPASSRPTDLLLDAAVTRFTEGYAAGVAPLRRALRAFRDQAARSEGDALRCLWLACPVAPEPLAPELWDGESWHALASVAIQLSRQAGALALLPVALRYRASLHVHAGELSAASALVDEADAITDATGTARVWHLWLMLAAWRGEEPRVLELHATGVRDATDRGEGRVLGLAGYATAVLYNGLCRYEAALAGAQRGCDDEDLGFFGWTLVELIEAAARSGDREIAVAALRRLEERTRPAGTDWALGMLARSSALREEGHAAESLYREAVERLERSRMAAHLARTHLVYGEWLRRAGRRVDARAQLRLAYEMLGGMGADAFAERARRELAATGETVRKRAPQSRPVLTAQEAQIARLAAEGHTNPEIGSQLFISPRTAEYHLHKVFTKLGISSRRGLRSALHGSISHASSS